MIKWFLVYDGPSFIGFYPAKSGEVAMAAAQTDQLKTAATFRKSQPAIIFKELRAVESTSEGVPL